MTNWKLVLFLAFFPAAVWILARFIAATDWKLAQQILERLEYWQPAVILLLSLAGHFLAALRWWLFLYFLGSHKAVRLRSLTLYNISAFAVSYLFPSADIVGKMLRIAFIQKSGVPATDSLLSISLEIFFSTIFEFPLRLLFLFTLGTFTFFGHIGNWYILLVPFIVAFFLILLIPLLPKDLILRFFPWIGKVPRLAQFIVSLEESRIKLEILRRRPSVALGILVLTIAINLAVALETWVILRFLGADTSMLFAFLVQSAFIVSGISMAPGGIGILETLEQEIFAAFDQAPGLVGAFIVILRSKDALWVIFGFIYLFLRSGVVSLLSFLKPSRHI